MSAEENVTKKLWEQLCVHICMVYVCFMQISSSMWGHATALHTSRYVNTSMDLPVMLLESVKW